MKNPNKSKGLTEQQPLIDRRTAITGLITLVAFGMGLRESCSGEPDDIEEVEENPALAYLGTWKLHGDKSRIKISNWPEENEKRPSETIKVGKNKEAKLILPVVSNIFVKRGKSFKILAEGFENIYGGFYDVDGMHVLILWFGIKDWRGKSIGTNICIAFRKNGEVIETRTAPAIQKYLTPKGMRIQMAKPKWRPIKPVK